jgi:hypothetical protein
LLTEWNLDAHGFRALITIQGSRMPRRVADRRSLFFCGARLADFHGLVVQADPSTNHFRLWDLDTGREEGSGSRFLEQNHGLVWVSSFGPSIKLVDLSRRSQLTWTLGFVPAGLAVLDDGSVMMPSSGEPAGSLHRLIPRDGRLISWTLPEEQVPFSGVSACDGAFFFVERRLSRIARFHPRNALLREWQLPAGSNPQVISLDRLGRVWFSDANFNDRIGRLDPRSNKIALFVKPGVVTFSVRPVDRLRLGRVVAATDLASYLDVLHPGPVREHVVRVCESELTPSTQRPSTERARIAFTDLVIDPTSQLVRPLDPPALLRFSTPVVAPIDLTEQFGAIYATAGVFDERKGPSRLFRMSAPGQRIQELGARHA